jgi:hypothetical protein
MTSITFRSALHTAVSDFLDDVGMGCHDTTNGLVEVIESLATYREEGKALFPEVWVMDDLPGVRAVCQAGEALPLGRGPRRAETARQALKECAPLAREGWAVYLLRTKEGLEYGLVRLPVSPLAVRPEMILGDAEPKLVRMVQVTENVVQIRCGQLDLSVHFDASRADGAPSPTAALDRLVAAVTRNVPEPLKQGAREFVFRTFFKAIQESHGALIAVVRADHPVPALFGDCVPLGDHAIDFAARIQELETGKDIESSAALVSAGQLLRGMISSDGVTVLTDAMKVVAYRAFIKHDKVAASLGGARKRTFHFLGACVAAGELVGVYYRSHDGGSDYKG